MPNGIEFFLTQCVQDTTKDWRGWDWHVLDSERLQQDILQILFNNSPAFCNTILGVIGSCIRQPQQQMFDLVVITTTGHKIFMEIKVDSTWSQDQKQRQADFLAFKDTRGAMMLFSQSAVRNTRSQVQAVGNGRFVKISYTELYKALDAVRQSGGPPELTEFADGYKVALQQQEQRTRDRFGDPDA